MHHLGHDKMEVVCGFDMSFSLGWIILINLFGSYTFLLHCYFLGTYLDDVSNDEAMASNLVIIYVILSLEKT